VGFHIGDYPLHTLLQGHHEGTMEVDETLGTHFNFENFKMHIIEGNTSDVNKYGNIGEPLIF
jgi:hypothetical protein